LTPVKLSWKKYPLCLKKWGQGGKRSSKGEVRDCGRQRNRRKEKPNWKKGKNLVKAREIEGEPEIEKIGRIGFGEVEEGSRSRRSSLIPSIDDKTGGGRNSSRKAKKTCAETFKTRRKNFFPIQLNGKHFYRGKVEKKKKK